MTRKLSVRLFVIQACARETGHAALSIHSQGARGRGQLREMFGVIREFRRGLHRTCRALGRSSAARIRRPRQAQCRRDRRLPTPWGPVQRPKTSAAKGQIVAGGCRTGLATDRSPGPASFSTGAQVRVNVSARSTGPAPRHARRPRRHWLCLPGG